MGRPAPGCAAHQTPPRSPWKVDPTVSEEQEFASKRERQKARRAERLEREAAAAQSQAGKKRLLQGLGVLLVIALIGGLVYSQIAARQERTELASAVEARLDELGCTEDVRMTDLGGGHIAGDEASLAAEPPQVIYNGDEPPSSGRHVGQVVATGVYDVPIDPRLTTHNLEHGYVVMHYAEDAPADQVEEMKAWAQEQIDGDRPKVVVTPYYGEIANGANFSFTAWFYRQTCDTFDADVAEVFADEHYETDEAPEAFVPTHNIGAQGVLDPDGEALFLPPLDTALGDGDGAEELEGVEAARPEADQGDDAEPVDEATE